MHENLTYRLKDMINRMAAKRGYHIEKRVDYGNHSLDVFQILLERLDPNRGDFFFIQVGAHDGVTSDAIHPLVDRYKWRGILIEPQPDVFTRLVANYQHHPQLTLINAAIAHSDAKVSLWTAPGSAGLLSSLNRSMTAARAVDSSLLRIVVDGLAFTTVVARHGVRQIDLLQIDAEGFDFEVIKMALAQGLPRPRLIRFEHIYYSADTRKVIGEYLFRHGYRLLRDGIDTLALHVGDQPPA